MVLNEVSNWFCDGEIGNLRRTNIMTLTTGEVNLECRQRVRDRKQISGLDNRGSVVKAASENTAGVRVEEHSMSACPICGYVHGSDSPHEASSMTYQLRFHREHGRLPTWEDAIAHCSEEDKDLMRNVLNAYRINPRATADLHWHRPVRW